MNYQNRAYSITFGDGGSLVSFKTEGKEQLSEKAASLPLFKLGIITEKRELRYLYSNESTYKAEFNEEEAVFNYDMIGGEDISAVVAVRLPKKDSFTYWHISVENNTDYILEVIDFPGICLPDKLKGDGGDNVFFWSATEGGLIEDLSLREGPPGTRYREVGYMSMGGWSGLYPGPCATQYMACYSEKDGIGLYSAALDDKGNLKQLEPHRVDEGIKMEYRLFPGTEEKSFSLPYEIVLGPFKGDWHDAAEIYRTWLESTDMLPPKIYDNHNLPDWYADSPVTIIYPVRGNQDTGDMTPNDMFPFINGAKVVEEYAEKLGCRVMALLMHWEGTAPWAPPRVWPPYGGEEGFREFVKRLHEKGQLVGVYCSGIGWTKESQLHPPYTAEANREYEEKNIESIACRTRKQTIEQSKIITPPIRSGIDICSHNDIIQDIVSEEVCHIADAGVDYAQYFDQNLGGLSGLCYSPDHSHPPIPGKWQTLDMLKLYSRLVKEIKERGSKMILGCELAAAEPFVKYLPFSDSRLTTQFYYGKPVPAYGYVFHEYLNNFSGNNDGTYWALDTLGEPYNMTFRIAQSFIAGNMQSIVLTCDGRISWGWGHNLAEVGVPDQDAAITLISNTNHWRTGKGKPYLFAGRMIKPAEVLGAGEFILPRRDAPPVIYPGVLYSKWQSRDGKEAQVIVNFRAEEMTVTLDTDKEYTLFENPDGTDSKLVGPGESITISGYSAVLAEF